MGLAVVASAGALWFGLWANAHVDYAHAMWLHFSMEADYARSLRAGGIVLTGLVAVLAWRLSRPRPPTPTPASAEEIERAADIVHRAPRADAHLALLGDKAFLFEDAAGDGDEGAGLLMYGISGRSWISMGDPIGPAHARQALAWRFLELADRNGGWPVFYEVGLSDLPLYLDLGLSLHKMGEEARIDLEAFSLEGSKRKSMRYAIRHCERDGATFEVLTPEEVVPLLDDLEAISNAWLAGKSTREKCFSLGAFSRDYFSRQHVALVRVEGRPVAFANLWMGGDREEICPDLMRYDPDASPNVVMEYLFAKLILHGKELGYRSFSLGMAPLSGLTEHHLGPLWNRVGAMLYQHGEHFYNFQGLREYKAKFAPEWEPRYLASPGGLSLPRVLTDVSTLVSGGIRGVVSR